MAKAAKGQRVAYIYSRLSQKRQRAGRGKKFQKTNTEKLCEREGWTIDKRFDLADDGRSGFHGDNLSPEAGLGKFLGLLRDGEIERPAVLCIDDLDRLTRSVEAVALKLFIEITEAGVWIATPDEIYERLDDRNAADVLADFSRAHKESKRKQKFANQSWDAKRNDARSGVAIKPGKYPGWLRPKKGGGWEEVPDHVATLKRIFRMAKEGTGCGVIAATLNSEGVRCWPPAKRWSSRLIHTTLTGRQCLGEWQPHRRVRLTADEQEKARRSKTKVKTPYRVPIGEPIKGHYLQVIDEQDWDAVQGGLSRRKRQRGPTKANPNLFSNLLRDPVNSCGYYLTLYMSSKKKWLKSMCRYGQPGMKRGTVPAVEYNRVEYTLMQMIHVMPLAPVDRDAQDRLDTLTAGLEGMEKRRQWLAANLANESSNDSPEEIRDALATVKAKIKEAKDEAQRLRLRVASRPHEAADKLRSLWSIEYLDKPAKEDEEMYRRKLRALMHEVVERIHIAIDIGTGMVKRHAERSLLVEIEYRNGMVQQGWSPPGVYSVQEDHLDDDGTGYRDRPYWDDRVFAWKVEKAKEEYTEPVLRMPIPQAALANGENVVAENGVEEDDGGEEGGKPETPYFRWRACLTDEELARDADEERGDELAEYAAWEIDRPSFVPRLAKGITAELLAAVVAKLVAQTEAADKEREERAKREAVEMEEAVERKDLDAIPPWER